MAGLTRAPRRMPLAAGGSMVIVTWIIVGLIAGLLADVLVRESGFGVAGDVVLGIVGALVGGWTFRALGWHAPFGGAGGAIVVAFIGAVIVLLLVHLVRNVVGSASRP